MFLLDPLEHAIDTLNISQFHIHPHLLVHVSDAPALYEHPYLTHGRLDQFTGGVYRQGYCTETVQVPLGLTGCLELGGDELLVVVGGEGGGE